VARELVRSCSPVDPMVNERGAGGFSSWASLDKRGAECFSHRAIKSGVVHWAYICLQLVVPVKWTEAQMCWWLRAVATAPAHYTRSLVTLGCRPEVTRGSVTDRLITVCDDWWQRTECWCGAYVGGGRRTLAVRWLSAMAFSTLVVINGSMMCVMFWLN
jgi:hypothetical protein